jgi:hypothetical protein
MIKRFLFGTFVAALALAVPVLAHDDYRIIGTVLSVTPTRIEVKQRKDKKTISMLIDGATLVTRDKKKVARSEVKVGGNVVVDARGDDIDDLQAVEIKLVPAPTTP